MNRFYYWLRNSVLLAICRWIIGNAVSLVAIPITVLAIIVSLHTDLFKETSKHVGDVSDYFKISTYYDVFEKQIDMQNDSLAPKQDINIKQDSVTKYTHIIYIDRTYSTKINENLFSIFKTQIQESIEIGEEKLHLNIKNDSLKNCLFAYFLQKLFVEKEKTFCNVNRMYVRFFDGNICQPYDKFNNPPDGIYRPENEYLDIQKIDKEKFDKELSKLLNISLLTPGLNNKQRQDQKSNFDALFGDLAKQCKKLKDYKLIVTIISDFDHDYDQISFDDLREKIPQYFAKQKKIIRQYNLIAYPPSSATSHLSDTLLNSINEYIIDYDNVIKIDLKNYGNNFINKEETKWNVKWKNFDSQYNAAFYSTNMDENSVIDFNYPKGNAKGISIATARIVFRGDCSQWRLTDYSGDEKIGTNKYRYYLGIDGEDENCIVNATYNDCEINKDIFIEINIQNELQKELKESKYKLEITTTDGRMLSYPIEFKESIQGKLPNFGKWLLNILWIIIVLIFISSIIVWIYHYYDFRYSIRRRNEAFFILFLGILLVFAFLCLQFSLIII
ncbi:MAG: ABC transporter permease [Candidatus Azobacteroides sp.]|nr:ABC transporter permease [Candidatus Azobacteroides sp.]